MGLGEVLLHAISTLVKVADLLFGLRKILVRRFTVPGEGLLVIAMDAAAVLKHSRQMILSERVALVCRETVVAYGPLVTLRQTGFVFIHAANLILRGRKVLCRGFAIPGQGLRVIERHIASAEVIIAESKLRLCIARTGCREQRVGISGRWRGRWTGSLRRRLCARHGSERE